MIAILRLLGIMNATVWLGAALFFTFGIAPAFFTPEMKHLLGDIYSGLVAQMVLERYFMLHYCCSAIALIHQLAEWVYLGKRLHRFTFGLLVAIIVFSVAGGAVLTPKLKDYFKVRYSAQASAVEKEEAKAAFRKWHGVSQVMNLALLLCLATFAVRVSLPPPNGTRFTTGKFRS